ncbi:hypothetical protein HI914_07283 [Erysiphe necator]|nr:hypothetical protein HI914_07283 [Erysiphe necator]
MTNTANIDTLMIDENNTLLNRLKYERTKLTLTKFASSNKSLQSANQNFRRSPESPNLLLSQNSFSNTSISSICFGNRLLGMAGKFNTQTQNQSILVPLESLSHKPVDLDANSHPSLSSGEIDSIDLSSQPGIKDLLVSAEGLLSRLQNAYVQRTSALNDMTKSRDNLVEELEASNTRVQNLRSQLETLATTISSKDQRIAELERELLSAKSNPCYYKSSLNKCHKLQNSNSLSQSYSSIDHECLTPEDHNCTNHMLIDLELEHESDCESSICDELFSRPQSPALTNTSSILTRSPHLRPVTYESPDPSLRNFDNKNSYCNERPKSQPYKSFFGFLSGRSSNKDVHTLQQESCPSCLGKGSLAAWDTVSLLQAENQGLKGRIVQLEDAVSGALDAIMGYY